MNEIFEKNEYWLKNFDKCFNKDKEIQEKFADIFNRFVEQKHIKATDFEKNTHIDRNTFRLWKQDVKRPSMKKFVAFCIAYKINIGLALYMMEKIEITFILTNKVHYAYYNLIQNFKCCNEQQMFIECNKILEKLNIDPVYWLGNDDDKWWDEEK